MALFRNGAHFPPGGREEDTETSHPDSKTLPGQSQAAQGRSSRAGRQSGHHPQAMRSARLPLPAGREARRPLHHLQGEREDPYRLCAFGLSRGGERMDRGTPSAQASDSRNLAVGHRPGQDPRPRSQTPCGKIVGLGGAIGAIRDFWLRLQCPARPIAGHAFCASQMLWPSPRCPFVRRSCSADRKTDKRA